MSNPVRRLVTILDEAKATKAQKAMNAWAEVFNVDSSDRAAVLFSVGELYRLVEEARDAALQAAEGMSEDVITRPFVQLTRLLEGMNLQAGWDDFKRKFEPDMMTGLRFCAEIVEREYGTGDLSDEDLEAFRAQAEELLQEVHDSDLPEGLKTVLIDNLRSFIRAVDQYKLRGLDGLSQSVDNGVGAVIRQQEEVAKVEHGVVAKYLLFLVAVEKAISIAQEARPMLAPVVRALLPETGVAE